MLDVGRNHLVEDVRQHICDKKDIPPHQQRLIFTTQRVMMMKKHETVQLEDGRTLSDYNIPSGATLDQETSSSSWSASMTIFGKDDHTGGYEPHRSCRVRAVENQGERRHPYRPAAPHF